MTDIETALRRQVPDEQAAARAAEAVIRRAAEAGLVDVAYAAVDTPFGRMLVAVTDRGLVRVTFPETPEETVLVGLARHLSPRILRDARRTDAVRRELDEYFEGRRRRFSVAVDWSLVHGFHRRVLDHTVRIPFGQVSTYRDLAVQAGSPLASRAAGNALATNPIPLVVPCHRVLRTGGALGGYGGGLDRKRFLLQLEGAMTATLP